MSNNELALDDSGDAHIIMKNETTTEIEATAFTIEELTEVIADHTPKDDVMEVDVNWFLAIQQAKDCEGFTLKDTARMFQQGIGSIGSHQLAYFDEFRDSCAAWAEESGDSFASVVLNVVLQFVGKGEGS